MKTRALFLFDAPGLIRLATAIAFLFKALVTIFPNFFASVGWHGISFR